MRYACALFLFFSLSSFAGANSPDIPLEVTNIPSSTVTVRVTVMLDGGLENSMSSAGTGFVINKKGHILMSYHVSGEFIEFCKNNPKNSLIYTIAFFNEGSFSAVSVETNDSPELDVVILKLDKVPQGIAPVHLGDSHALELGECVYAMRGPVATWDEKIMPKIVPGVLTDKKKFNQHNPNIPFLYATNEIFRCYSGGPLAN